MEVFGNNSNSKNINNYNKNNKFYDINGNVTCVQPIALVKYLVVGRILAKFHYNSA